MRSPAAAAVDGTNGRTSAINRRQRATTSDNTSSIRTSSGFVLASSHGRTRSSSVLAAPINSRRRRVARRTS
jgi:hypothetical protein